MDHKAFLQWVQQPGAGDKITPPVWRKPLIMGILNVTPDSFSDGGCFLQPAIAWQRAQAMIAEGVDIIDVGGESSRPAALPISADEELARVIPVIARIRQESDIAISVDTHKPEVMRSLASLGISLINDIRALQSPGALVAAKALNVPVCLMHMRESPQTMQQNPHYDSGVLVAISQFFGQRIEACTSAGIPRHYLLLDPGFGFGKNTADNLTLVKNISAFNTYGLPLILGVSRKSTLGAILNAPTDGRLIGGLTIAIYCAMQHLQIIRTHDVAQTHQAFATLQAIMTAV